MSEVEWLEKIYNELVCQSFMMLFFGVLILMKLSGLTKRASDGAEACRKCGHVHSKDGSCVQPRA